MVAIFTGSGLGTFNSSVTQLGQSGGSRLGQGRDSYGINAATGNLVIQALDESLLTRGFGTAAVRTYNSQGLVSGVGQDGWVTGYERSVKLTGDFMAANSYVTLSNGEGEDIVFKYNAQQHEYISTVGAGAHDQMTWDGDNWWHIVDGAVSEIYGENLTDGDISARSVLTSILHQNMRYSVKHDALGRVTAVQTLTGDASISYSYVGDSSQLSAVTTSENGVRKGQVTYGYEAGTGRLSWVQTDLTPDNGSDNAATGNLDGRLFRTDYAYVTSNANDLRIESVRTSDGAMVSFEYEPMSAGGRRVISVTEGGVKTRFAYNGTSTDVKDANGAVLLTYRYDAAGQTTAILERAVNGIRACTSFAYDGDGNVVRISKYGVDDATGNAGAVLEDIRYRYDSHGNRTQQRDRLNNIVKWEYNTADQVTSEIRYTLPDGDAIDDDQAGNLASLDPNSALTTHYVYDSTAPDRLRYVIDASGNVRELVYGSGANDSGQVVLERRFVGNERYTGTLYTAADLNLWAAQASTTTGTLRRANSSVVAYSYDALGRMARSIEYARTTNAGAGDPSDADAITFYTYDIHGLLRQSIVSHGAGRTETSVDARSLVTDYVYDGMGRLLSVLKRGAGVAATSPSASTDPAGAAAWDAATLLTTYAYVDSQKQIIVTQDSGLLHIESRDSAGAVTTVVEQPAASGSAVPHTMKNYYDARGRLVATENAANGHEYYFYDEAGRLTATVDETGAVTTTEYDAIGRKLSVHHLATRVDTSGWIQSGAVVVTSVGYTNGVPGQATLQTSGDDRWTTYAYDASGRLAGTTDSSGAETTYQYDAANRLVRVTQWGDYYGWGGGSSSLTKRSVPQPSGRDTRVTRMFYDNADRLIGTLDAEGYLTETLYDAGGRAVKSIRYGGQASSADRVNGTLAQLKLSAVSATDQITRQYYDGRGRLIGTLDAEGYLTTVAYDEARSSQTTVEYAAQLGGIADGASLSTLVTMAASNVAAGAPRTSIANYNQLGLLASTINPEGTTTTYRYDDAGRLVSTEVASTTGGVVDTRASGRVYDVFGNVIVELDAIGMSLLPTATDLNALYAQHGIRHSYDLLGRCQETTDQGGNKTWYYYDAAGRQTFVVRGVADAAGHANALGEVSELRYNAFGEVSATVAYDRRIGIPSIGVRPSEADLTAQLASLLATSPYTQFSYDLGGHLAQRIDADGAYTDYGYNRYGELRDEVRISNLGAGVRQTSYTRDHRGLITNTNESDLANGAARGTSQRYDAFGRLIQSTDARGVDRVFAYDKLGRSVSSTLRNVDGRDLTTTTAYDAFDRVLVATDALGNQTRYVYDDAAHSMTVTSPEGVVFTTIHNGFGQTVKTIKPLPGGSQAVETFEYDARGLLIKSTDALGKTTQQQYDDRGLLIRTLDATNRVVEFTYDAAGRVLKRTVDPGQLNLVTRHEYDALGRQLNVIDPSGRLTTMRYDVKGQLIEVAQDPNGLNLRTTYTWDSEGHQLSVTEAAGTTAERTTSYEYDGFGRRISETVDPNGLALRTDYAYDANGNLVSKTTARGTQCFVYDNANRMVYAVDANGGVTQTRYDDEGRVVETCAYVNALANGSYYAGMRTQDLAQEIIAQGIANANRDIVRHVVYNRDGSVVSTIDSAGSVVNTYDSAGRLQSTMVSDTQAAGGVRTDRTLYDASGKPVYTLSATGQVAKFSYDAAGRTTVVRRYAALYVPPTISSISVASLDAFTASNPASISETTVYDSAGRAWLTIGSDGAVVETRYNTGGDAVAVLRYVTRLDASQMSALSSKLDSGTATALDFSAFLAAGSATAAADYTVYDGAGRGVLHLHRIDASKLAVEEVQYDAGGRVAMLAKYTVALARSATLDAALLTGNAPGVASFLAGQRQTAQVVRHVYDSAGRLRFEVNGLGEVDETRYDAEGNVCAKVAYNVRLSAASDTALLGALQAGNATASHFSSFVAANDAGASINFVIRDAAGRVCLEIERTDATHGIVIEHRYDAVGQEYLTRSYVQSVLLDAQLTANLSSGALTSTDVGGIVSQAGATARMLLTVHDSAGRVRCTIDGEGGVIEHQYNGAGQEIAAYAYTVRMPSVAVSQCESDLTTGAFDGSTVDAFTAANAASAQAEFNIYDGDGQIRFKLRRTGAMQYAVSQLSYNGAGLTTETVRFTATLQADAALDAAIRSGTADVSRFTTFVTTNRATAQSARMIYDSTGRLRFTVNALGSVAEMRYDALGNVVSTLDYATTLPMAGQPALLAALGAGTATVADFAGYVAANESAASLTASIRDLEGNEVVALRRVSGLQFILEQKTYDAAGRLAAVSTYTKYLLVTPAMGAQIAAGNARVSDFAAFLASNAATTQNEWRTYDASGRLTYLVNGAGSVTRTVYDAEGRTQSTIQYRKPIAGLPAASSVVTEAQIAALVVPSADDHRDYNIYDAANRLVGHVHDTGIVQFMRYDGAGQLVQSIATAATVPTGSTLMAKIRAGAAVASDIEQFVVANLGDAHVVTTFRDLAGRSVYSLSRSGAQSAQVVEAQYDAAGNVLAEIHYGFEISSVGLATSADVAAAIHTALSSLPPGSPSTSRTIRYYYDSAGRQRFKADPTGAVVEQRFDGAGQIIANIDYGVRPTAADLANFGALAAWSATQPASSTHISTQTYDLEGRLIARTDGLGHAERYEYDATGNKIAYTNRDNARWTYAYDACGRLIEERTPQIMVFDKSNAGGLRSVVTQYQYDGAGHVTAKIQDALGATRRVTRFVYDARGQLVRTALPSLIESNNGDAFVSDAANAIDTTYDSFGQSVVVKDANGNFSYKVYDALGRVIFDIDQMLVVTGHTYDAFGNEVLTTRYANALRSNAPALVAAGWQEGQAISESLLGLALVTSAQDRHIESSYTLIGQKSTVMYDAVDYYKSDGTRSNGRPTLVTTYNAYGEVVKTSVLLEGAVGNASSIWSETYHYFDAMGREVMSVDPEGYVNTNQYDAYGNIVRKTQHATRLWPTGTAPQSLSTDQPPSIPPPGNAQTGYDRVQTYGYDAIGRVTSETNWRYVQSASVSSLQLVGVTSTIGYDNEGHAIRNTDDYGTTETTYDALGHATLVKGAMKRVAVDKASNGVQPRYWSDDATYLLEGRVLSDKSKDLTSNDLYELRGQLNEMRYDAYGNVVRSIRYTDGTGSSAAMDAAYDVVSDFDYDRRGRMVWDNRTGTEYTYDNCDRVLTAQSRAPRYASGTALDPVPIFDMSGFLRMKIVYEYDKAGNGTGKFQYRSTQRTAQDPQAFVLDKAEVCQYNAFGEIVAKDDRVSGAFAGNNFAVYEYGKDGQVARSNADGGAWKEYGYDLGGRGVRIASKSFTYVLDASGHAQQSTVDAITTTAFDRLGRAVLQRLPSNTDDATQRPEIERRYDRWGNVVYSKDARGYETFCEYNDFDKVVKETRPTVRIVDNHGVVTYGTPTVRTYYNAHGLVTEIVDPNGNRQVNVYDGSGQLVQTIDGVGNVTRHAYDVIGREVYTQLANGLIRSNAYTRDDKVYKSADYGTDTMVAGSVKRKRTTLSTYQYSVDGDRLATTDALGHTSYATYDSSHNMLSSISAAGVKHFYAYDRQGRKILDGNEIDRNTWSFDYFGRQIDHDDMGHRDNDTVYHQDTGQLIDTVIRIGTDNQPTNTALSAPVGQVAALSGNEEQRFYYASGLIKEIRRMDAATQKVTTTRYEYDKAGNRVVEESLTRDSSGTVVAVLTKTSYDSNGRVSSVRQWSGNGDAAYYYSDSCVFYTYDAAGNRRQVITGKPDLGPWTYATAQEAYVGVPIYDTMASIKDFAQKVFPGFVVGDAAYKVEFTLDDGSPAPAWLHFDPMTLSLTGTPPSVQNLNVRVRITDKYDQHSESWNLKLNVLQSRPPVANYGFDWSKTCSMANAELNWDFSSAFSDPEGQAMTYTLIGAPAGVEVIPGTATVRIRPQSMSSDSATTQHYWRFKIRAEDATHVATEQYVELTTSNWTNTATISYPLGYPPTTAYDIGLSGAFPTLSGVRPTISVISDSALGSTALPSTYYTCVNFGPSGGPDDYRFVATSLTRSLHGAVRVRATYGGVNPVTIEKILVLDVSFLAIHPGHGGDGLDVDANRVGVSLDDAGVDVGAPALVKSGLSTTAVPPLDQRFVDPGDSDGGGGGGGGGGNSPCTPIVGPGPTFIQQSTGVPYGNPYKSLWFDYDANNRVIIGNANLANGNIVLGSISPGTATAYGQDPDISYSLTYDSIGNVAERHHLVHSSPTQAQEYVTNFGYTLRGLKLTRSNDHVVGGQAWLAEDFSYNDAMQLTSSRQRYAQNFDAQQRVSRMKIFEYDLDGRQRVVSSYSGGTLILGFGPWVWNDSGICEFGGLSLSLWRYADTIPELVGGGRYGMIHTTTQVTDLDDAHDGRVSSIRIWNNAQENGWAPTSEGPLYMQYEYSYGAQEGYLETSVYGNGGGNPTVPDKYTVSQYDAWGRRTTVAEGNAATNFVYNEDGQILRRTEGYAQFKYAYAKGQMVSALNNYGWIDVVGQLTDFSNTEASAGTTTVQNGESLRDIAQRCYGDDKFWYVIASANGVSDNAALQAGTVLKVPRVEVHRNSATTFKPYNPADQIGSTMPALEFIPPPPPGPTFCQQFTHILMIVVAVVVTAVCSYYGGFWGAVVGAAFASVLSQGVDIATGLQKEFDWGSLITDVAVAAITEGIASGVGSAIDGIEEGAKGFSGLLVSMSENAWISGAAKAVTSNLVNYGVNWVANRLDSSRSRDNEKFNWGALAASAVTGALSGGLKGWLSGKNNFNGAKIKEKGDFGAAKWFGETAVLKSHAVQSLLINTSVNFMGNVASQAVENWINGEGRGVDLDEAIKNAATNAVGETVGEWLGPKVKKMTDRWFKSSVAGASTMQGEDSAEGELPSSRTGDSLVSANNDLDPSEWSAYADPELNARLKAEWDNGPGQKYQQAGDDEVLKKAINHFESGEITESEAAAARKVLEARGYKLSKSKEGISFNSHDVTAAKISLVDQGLSEDLKYFKAWTPGSDDFTKDDFVGEIQGLIGVKQDSTWGMDTMRALSRYLDVPGVQNNPSAIAGEGGGRKADAGSKTTPVVQAPVAGDGDIDKIIAAIGSKISAGEGSYESYNTGTRNGKVVHSYMHPAEGTVTGKTINQILQSSKLPPENRGRMFAVGKYQIITKTLRAAKKSMNLSGDELFDAEMQERIFKEYLIHKAGGGKLADYVFKGKGSVDDAMYAASKEWASIAAPKGRRISKDRISDGTDSYYESKANHASMKSTNAVKAYLLKIGAMRSAIKSGGNAKKTMPAQTPIIDGGASISIPPDDGRDPGGMDLAKSLTTLRKNAHAESMGYCARYVRWALEAGGVDTSGHPDVARKYGPLLEKRGFTEVKNYDARKPVAGDVAVFQERYKGHAGHIQMYDGTRWISDFKQNHFLPGSKYKGIEYKVYRYTGD